MSARKRWKVVLRNGRPHLRAELPVRTPSPAPAVNGWCGNPEHNAEGDHLRRETCTDFKPESEVMAELDAQNAEYDRAARAAGMPSDGGASARYVAEHRPY